MIKAEYLKQLSKWAGFVGLMNIILGAVSAIGGLFVFVVGAIPGIITIILGVKLRQAKKYADEMLASSQDDDKMNMMIMQMNTYFMIQGILLIILLTLAVLGLLSGLFAGYFLISKF